MILALFRMPYNSLTLFKYLYISIDGSIFLLVLLVLFINISKNLALRFKSGCKGKRFIFNCQTFFKVFFRFFFLVCFSGSLCERERCTGQEIGITATLANRTTKIRTFIFIFQTFSEVFCSYPLSASALYNRKSLHQGFPLLESGCKSRGFSVTNQIYHTLFFIYFWRIMLKRWTAGML